MRMKRGQNVNRSMRKFPFHECLHIMAESVDTTMIVRPGLRLYRSIIITYYYFAFAHHWTVPTIRVDLMRELYRNKRICGYSRWFIVFLFSRLSICKYNSFLSNAKTKPKLSQSVADSLCQSVYAHAIGRKRHEKKNVSREIGMARAANATNS